MTKEKQNIKLEKVDDKTAYENLLVKYAELENKIADIKANCDLAIEGRDIKIKELERQIEKMKCCQNCKNLLSLEYGEFSCDLYGECKHCSKWEITENDRRMD